MVAQAKSFPRWTDKHALACLLMALLAVVCAAKFNIMDPKTHRPVGSYMFTAIAYSTNIFIKNGLMHFILYTIEALYDQQAVKYHIGQRVTTLWAQALQNPRWGQHLHMQVECLLQICDVLGRESKRPLDKKVFGERNQYGQTIKGTLYCIALTCVVTNGITSIGYHNLYEQCMGLACTALKLIFDYYQPTEEVNYEIGSMYLRKDTLITGILAHVLFFITFHFGLLDWLLHSSYDDNFLLHPTTVANVVFFGCLSKRLLS